MAALDIVAEQGFQGASMSDIAAAAGLAKASLYDYFDSRNELISYAVKLWIVLLEQEGERQIEAVEDPVRQLQIFVESIMESFLADKRTVKITMAVFHLMLSEKSSKKWTSAMFKSVSSVVGTIKQIIEEGARKRMFRPEASEYAGQIALNLMTFLDGISVYYFLDEGRFDLEEQVNLHIRMLIDSLRANRYARRMI
ncbi:MAG: TetR/AcrR family transcriptional regulator [Gemmatimonadota bacterium]|nr:TetR/AcrR family transcriptional regulator [Gemmatimonadota bacterium]